MKRRILELIIFLLFGCLGYAQQPMSKVVLRNGATVTGTIKEFNAASHIVLTVAGFETRIEMADVESVEEVRVENVVQAGSEQVVQPPKDEDYPETYTLKVGPYDVEMRLVRGTTFSMGYDGSGSRKMESEPVHEVTLSSFYINSKPLSKDVVAYVKKGTKGTDKKEAVYRPSSWKDANEVAEKVSQLSGLTVNLITEAQWEFVAVNTDDIMSTKGTEVNFCRDYYGSYPSSSKPQVDPVGPKLGSSHVVRCFSGGGDSVYQRYKTDLMPGMFGWALRVTMPAKAVE